MITPVQEIIEAAVAYDKARTHFNTVLAKFVQAHLKAGDPRSLQSLKDTVEKELGRELPDLGPIGKRTDVQHPRKQSLVFRGAPPTHTTKSMQSSNGKFYPLGPESLRLAKVLCNIGKAQVLTKDITHDARTQGAFRSLSRRGVARFVKRGMLSVNLARLRKLVTASERVLQQK